MFFETKCDILAEEVIFLNDQINYYEYKVQEKATSKQKFKRFGFKFTTLMMSILLTVLLLVILGKKAEAAFLFFMVVSPAFGVALYLFTVYFFNGYFYTSYEYIIQSGNLKITKVNGGFVFGKTYRTALCDMRIANLDKIAPFKYKEGSTNNDIKTYYALSSKDHSSAYYIDFNENGERIRVVFETTPRMLSMLKFHNSEKMV